MPHFPRTSRRGSLFAKVPGIPPLLEERSGSQMENFRRYRHPCLQCVVPEGRVSVEQVHSLTLAEIVLDKSSTTQNSDPTHRFGCLVGREYASGDDTRSRDDTVGQVSVRPKHHVPRQFTNRNHVGCFLKFYDLLVHERAPVVHDKIRVHWAVFFLALRRGSITRGELVKRGLSGLYTHASQIRGRAPSFPPPIPPRPSGG